MSIVRGEVMGTMYQREHRIESDLSAVKRVEREILTALAEMGYSEDDVFNVRLALDEACINAVKHGNRNNPAKSISVRVEADEDTILIEVADEGTGFDYTRILDPRDVERLQETGGRGLFLIQQFMEQVDFSETGNSICMRYRKGKDPDQVGPIRKRVFSGVAIIEILGRAGEDMADTVIEEVTTALDEGERRLIVDMTRVKDPCPDLRDAVIRCAEMADSRGGILVVSCSPDDAESHLGESRSIPLLRESLPDAVRFLCRGEVQS